MTDVYKSNHSLLVVFMASLCLLGMTCGGAVSTATDADKYVVDGAMLTRNWDVRYIKASPVDISVKGKTAEEAVLAVDGDRHGKSGVSWKKGDQAEAVIDFKRNVLVTALAIQLEGDADWKINTSTDGKSWQAVPAGLTLRTPNHAVIHGLARICRFVRINAAPRDEGLTIEEIFVYGEKNARPGIIGGIYPSNFPPIAGQQVTLRAVLRNTGNEPITNVRVQFRAKSPKARKIGECVVASVGPGQSAIASVPWTPTTCEPYKISVELDGAVEKKVIPVVNRKLYFGCFSPPHYERHPLLNFYTANGSETETDAAAYLMAKLHGVISLAHAAGPAVLKGKSAEVFESRWGAALSAPYRDGVNLDEIGYPNQETTDAMKRVYPKREGKLIVAWMATAITEGHIEALRNTDLDILEIYCNMFGFSNFRLGHGGYRHDIKQWVDSGKTGNLSDQCIVSLGYFVNSRPTIPDELEREVRYARIYAPKMPGIIFYGSTWRDDERIWDDLAYKYFVAPVIHIEDVAVSGSTATVELVNMGGMNARNVKLGLYSPEDKRTLTTEAVNIPAGGMVSLKLDIKSSGTKPDIRVIPSESYTVLEDKPFEIMPSIQVKGNPLQASWTSDDVKLNTADYIEFVSASTGKVVQTVKPGESGNFRIISRGIKTDDLSPGDYLVRLVDGDTGELKASDRVSIVLPNAKLFATAVNSQPWKGDPQRVEVKVGDSFDVNWDVRDCRVPSPVICVSAPGESLRMPLSNSSYAYADIARLRSYLITDPEGDPMQKGVWTWRTMLRTKDFLTPEEFNDIVSPQSWIRDGKNIGVSNPKVNMNLTPGEWRLWIATESDVVDIWAVPKSSVLTVVVR